jgi:hypothetical protein
MLENKGVNKISALRPVKVKPWIFILLIPLLTSCATIKHLLYTYDPLNLHDVKESVLYRSAQPSGKALSRAVQE